MVIVLMAFIPDMRVALYVAPIWFLILYVGYKAINVKSGKIISLHFITTMNYLKNQNIRKR